MTNTKSTPIEALERAYPMRVLRCRLRRGRGAWPGGEPGSVGENWLLPGGDEARAERLPDKCTIRLRAGDALRMLTPGGGWGRPPSAAP